MNPINKKALELTNTSPDDFLNFCKLSKRNKTDRLTRQIYFKKILQGEIIKDNKTNKIKILEDK